MRLAVVCAWTAVLLGGVACQQDCSRIPENLYGRTPPKTPGSNGYEIVVSGNHSKYVPGETYTVELVGFHTKVFRQKFEGFYLAVEAASPVEYGLSQRVGHFQLFGGSLTRFSDTCPNMVTHTSLAPKTDISVMWTAPPAGSGCVVFRATVIEHRDVWYKDDGSLSRELCEQVRENRDEQPTPLDTCCACDEAKYEVTFEGLWSRHTHPKDFPRDEWDTAFSDVIGASHSSNFRFWEYDKRASEGVRQVAEWGETKKLEIELKTNSEHIRTIIKARGLEYPNLQSKTFAVFRVDKEHHQASLIARLKPSPDWLVGVSAMELCLRNCSWAERQVLNLRPWDAGTNNGVSYLSSNSPTIPQQKVQRITSKWPANSPFYDPSGKEIPPLARLIIQRQRVYDRFCPDGSSDVGGGAGLGLSDPADSRARCATTSWSSWSPCSASCGQGVKTRRRQYRDAMAARIMACSVRLQGQTVCRAPIACDLTGYGGADAAGLGSTYGVGADDAAECAVTEWSPWTPCSVTCGRGTRSRHRNFRSRLGRKRCHQKAQDRQPCSGEQPVCLEQERIPPGCEVTPWSEWSPCSSTCGPEGVQVRRRMLKSQSAGSDRCNVRLDDRTVCRPTRVNCSVAREEALDICTQPQDVGSCRNGYERWHYSVVQRMCVKFIYGGCRGNQNNFRTLEECSELCEEAFSGGQRVDEFGTTYTAPAAYDGAAGGAFGAARELGGPERAPPVGPTVFGSPQYGPPPGAGRRRPGQLLGSSQVINPLLATGSRSQLAELSGCRLSSWGPWGACSASCSHGTQQRRRAPLSAADVCPQRRLVRYRQCRWLPDC